MQPGLLQLHGDVLDLAEGLDEHRLGDLQRNHAGLRAACPDRFENPPRAVFHQKMLYRKVDPHSGQPKAQAGPPHERARPAEGVFADAHHKAVPFRDGDHLIRGQEPALRVPQAEQGFGRRKPARAEVHEGLIPDLQRPVPQPGFQQPQDDGLVAEQPHQRGVVGDHAVLPLGVAQGDLHPLKQLLRRVGVHGVGADADVDADREHVGPRLDGHRQRLPEPVRDGVGMFLPEMDAEEDVAVDAVDVSAEEALQAPGNLAQDLVPGLDVEKVVVIAERAYIDAEQAEPALLVIGNQHVRVAQVLAPVPHGVYWIIIGELFHMAAVLVEGHGELHDVQIGRVVESDARLPFGQKPALFGEGTDRRFALEPRIELAKKVPEQFRRRPPALRADEEMVPRLKEEFRPAQIDLPQQLQRKPLRQIGHLLFKA